MTSARTSPSRRRHAAAAIALLTILAAVLVPTSLGRDSRSAAAVKTVNVKTLDARISLSAKTAPVGKVKFVVKNLGKKPHNFRINGKKTPALKTGKTSSIVVTFKRAGTYAYLSTLPGDAKAGLKGTFRLTAPPKPATPGNAKAGRSLFIANCGSCHTLKAANTRGTIGPNLDSKALAYAAIVKIVTNGKNGSGGAMPPFGGTLGATGVKDVSAFLYASTH